jgi:RNA polymerase sigma factor (sigma-70 family)
LYSALKNIENLRETDKFGPWLRTIVIRAAKHHNISNSFGNNKNYSEIPYETNISIDISDMEKQELSVLIREAVGNLHGILRETISLYYFEGYNVEQIADFLDIPTGTVKRRLHDGRNALRETAQKILMGTKPMNANRQEILKQINDFLETGGDAEAFHKIAKRAMSLRPLPYELLGELVRKHSRTAKKLARPGGREELELRASKVIDKMNKPSRRVMDVTNPVGKTLAAIKKALPEFKE